jgi:uncharacterized protein YkwD
MSTRGKPAWWRLIAGADLIVAIVATLDPLDLRSEPSADAAATSSGAGACKGADRPAAHLGARKVRKQVRCLINEQRRERGLEELDRSKSLRVASQRHAEAMVANDCLAHRCGDEPDLETRLQRAGYFRDASWWRYAESTGCGPSAEAMVANWMATRYHRENILERAYRDIGVGVADERIESRCDRGYATFAVVFGRRHLGS